MTDSMAVEPADVGNLPAIPEEDMVGLEDFDNSDMVMPRISIDHEKAKFSDNLTNKEYDTLHCVGLGLVKQRILWPAEMDDGDGKKQPLCKSYNHEVGVPFPARFPWKQSGFDMVPGEPGEVQLPCESCALTAWDSHPRGGSPWCTEQYTFIIMQEIDEGNFAPAIVTVQRTGIKPAKNYLTSFKRDKMPMYTAYTEVTLEGRRRGTVDFAVPKFIKGGESPRDLWPVFAQTYRDLREFLQTPRDLADEGITETEDGDDQTLPEPDNDAPAAATAPGDLPF